MNPEAFRFPSRLKHPSGKWLSLSPEHLLVEFRKPPDRATLYRSIEKLRLRSVSHERAHASKRRDERMPAINDTDVRFWFRTPKTLPRNPEFIRSLEAATKSGVRVTPDRVI